MVSASDDRSTEQIALEKGAGEVSDVLLNLEHSISRAKRALKTVRKDGVDTNAEFALSEAITSLEQIRKRLQQDTYFAGNSLRLM